MGPKMIKGFSPSGDVSYSLIMTPNARVYKFRPAFVFSNILFKKSCPKMKFLSTLKLKFSQERIDTSKPCKTTWVRPYANSSFYRNKDAFLRLQQCFSSCNRHRILVTFLWPILKKPSFNGIFLKWIQTANIRMLWLRSGQ